MKTQKFTAYIKSLQYKVIENDGKYVEPIQYCIQANLLECKKGMKYGQKTYHNALIFMTEEQYNSKVLGVMDKIEISENAQWKSKYMSLNIYDTNKLKGIDESKLQKDVNGRTFSKVSFYAYTVNVKKDDWKLVEKADEICYIQCGKVKFYIDESQLDEQAYCFFFDKDTYDKIIENNMREMEMNCYLHKQKKWRKLIELQTAFDEDSGRYFANLIVKDNELNEEV